jgi:hypothetical protein
MLRITIIISKPGLMVWILTWPYFTVVHNKASLMIISKDWLAIRDQLFTLSKVNMIISLEVVLLKNILIVKMEVIMIKKKMQMLFCFKYIQIKRNWKINKIQDTKIKLSDVRTVILVCLEEALIWLFLNLEMATLGPV